MTTARLALVAAVVLTTACTRRPSAAESTSRAAVVSVSGSDTMVLLGQRWAETLMTSRRDVAVQVTGGGTGTGIAALIGGTTDICQASRRISAEERAAIRSKRGVDAEETRVALDAIVIYVHPSNRVDAITLDQLRRIYAGELTSWGELGGADREIVVYGRENNSGTYAFFKERVLASADFAASVQALAGTSAVVAAVRGDSAGIGYGGVAYTTRVKALRVGRAAAEPAFPASLATARDGTYPLSRPLFLYTAGPPVGAAQRFVDFVLSPEGQAVIERVGFFPLDVRTRG